MDKNTLIATCDRELRLLRSEFGLTQDDMARELGISKKTLVGIEKGRSSLGWTGSAALCLLFGDSQTLRRELDGDPADMAAGLREHTNPTVEGNAKIKKMSSDAVVSDKSNESDDAAGGISSPLWRLVGTPFGIRAEQNLISEHYRLIDGGRRLFASFDYAEIEEAAARLSREKKMGGAEDETKQDRGESES